MTLFRAMSDAERDDYQASGALRTAQNTLEAKQFFRSEQGARDFAQKANQLGYEPPYTTIYILHMDEAGVNALPADRRILDGHAAITVAEEQLETFNNCVNFTENYVF